jgi:hypothetical protein
MKIEKYADSVQDTDQNVSQPVQSGLIQDCQDTVLRDDSRPAMPWEFGRSALNTP